LTIKKITVIMINGRKNNVIMYSKFLVAFLKNTVKKESAKS